MLKGITRQVIVVKAQDQKIFDQAIFLVRDDVLADGGITEERLLSEAKIACKCQIDRKNVVNKLLWSISGALITGIIWFLSITAIRYGTILQC